ncbi:MAG TPA: VOC family protein [Sphingobium sp.]
MTDISSQPALLNPVMARGTLLARDLDRLAQFSETVLGLEAVRIAPDRMALRDRRSHNEDSYWVLDVAQAQEIEVPQSMLNHWGVTVESREEVDRAHAVATEHQQLFGIKRIQKPSFQHESYSFYIGDADNNWWEVEYREPSARYENLVDIASRHGGDND